MKLHWMNTREFMRHRRLAMQIRDEDELVDTEREELRLTYEPGSFPPFVSPWKPPAFSREL